MPYDFQAMRVVMEAVETESGDLAPSTYVVAGFEEPLTEYFPPLRDDADTDRMTGLTPPIRFLAADDIDILYKSRNSFPVERRRAGAARSLLSLYDDLDACSESADCVPTEIAMQPTNRPSVAMYLFAYEHLSYGEIADLFGVERETISRYKRRVG